MWDLAIAIALAVVLSCLIGTIEIAFRSKADLRFVFSAASPDPFSPLHHRPLSSERLCQVCVHV
jgi:hypothetical protein